MDVWCTYKCTYVCMCIIICVQITNVSIFDCALHMDLWRRHPAKPLLGPASHALQTLSGTGGQPTPSLKPEHSGEHNQELREISHTCRSHDGVAPNQLVFHWKWCNSAAPQTLPLQTVHKRQHIDGKIKQKSVQPGEFVKFGPVLHTNVSIEQYIFSLFFSIAQKI